jgi:hypothetical protein
MLRKDLLAVQADVGGEDFLRLRIRQTEPAVGVQ